MMSFCRCTESAQAYVYALNSNKSHEVLLSNQVPRIKFTVEAKADANTRLRMRLASLRRSCETLAWRGECGKGLSRCLRLPPGVFGSGYRGGR